MELRSVVRWSQCAEKRTGNEFCYKGLILAQCELIYKTR